MKTVSNTINIAVIVILLLAPFDGEFSPMLTLKKAEAVTFGNTISKPLNDLGLVGHWTFDGEDMVQGKVMDRSGQGNHGSAVNMSTSTMYVAGKLGQALRFDGVNDYVKISSNPLGTSDATINVWIKLRTLTNSRIFAASAFPYTDLQFTTTNNKFAFTNDAGTTNAVSANNSASVNVWQMVTAVRNSSNQITLYVNGVQSGSANQSAGTPTAGSAANYIGTRFDASSGFFPGLIDDVRIYNRALSAQEIKQLYNQSQSKYAVTPTTYGSLSQGLVGHWTFDGKDMPQGKVMDRSGQGNHGSAVNMSTSTMYVAGKLGQALRFDGGNDYVDAGASDSLYFNGTPFTISFWINPIGFGGATLVGIFSKGENTVGSKANNYVCYYNVSATNIVCGIGNTTTAVISGNVSISPKKWHNLVFKNDLTNIYVYLDNVLRSTVSNTLTGTAAGSGKKMLIGGWQTNCSSGCFPGNFDDFRIYNRALSASEIKRLYNQSQSKYAVTPTTYGSLKDGLVGHWTFDGKDMIGGRVDDRSGQGNHGSAVNMSTSTMYVAGKLGQALRFDGVDDYVNAGSGSTLDDLGPLTYSAWINPSKLGTSVVLSGAIIVSKRTRAFGLSNIKDPTFPVTLRMFISGATTNGQPNCDTLGISLNKWQHVLVTWDGVLPFTGIFYINGVACTTGSGNLGSGAVSTDATEIQYIGSDFSRSDGYFGGKIDDVRIYNRVLSATEIKQLYLLGR